MDDKGAWWRKPGRQLDEFVKDKKAELPAGTVRLNCNIPADLHRRMKVACAMDGRDMTEVIVETLEQRFPNR